MGRLRRPELPPGALADLVRELHALHARAGRPSMRELAKGQRFSYTAVHDLFTKTIAEPPKLPVLLTVVEQLAMLAPRMNVDETLDRFDELWRAADAEPSEKQLEDTPTAASRPNEVEASGRAAQTPAKSNMIKQRTPAPTRRRSAGGSDWLQAGRPQIHRRPRHPANAAISTFGRPSARHNMIRARVATEADTSALFTSAANSTR